MKIHHPTSRFTVVELEPGDLSGDAYGHWLRVGEEATSVNGKVPIRIAAEAVAVLGDHGRLLGEDKREVLAAHPGQKVMFNACIFDADGTEIWFGDLVLPDDEPRLRRLGQVLGQIYVTPELPFRWEGLPAEPDADERILGFRP